MHDIKWIRENPEAFDEGLTRRGLAPQSSRLLAIDASWRSVLAKLESEQARRKILSKEIGQAKSKGGDTSVQRLSVEVANLKDSIAAMEDKERKISQELVNALAQIPNLPLPEVPNGKDANDNVEHHRFGSKPNYTFPPKQHFELGENLREMDFQTAAKLSGARFVVLRKDLARLERALAQFMLDLHTEEHGYTEISPPLLVRDEAMFGTAQLPKFEDDQFLSTEISTFRNVKHVVEEWTNLFQGEGAQWPPKQILDAVRLRISNVFKHSMPRDDSAGVEKIRDLFRTLVTLNYDPLVIDSAVKRAITKLGISDQTIQAIRAESLNESKRRLWLIPTAEVPLTNLVRDSIRAEAELPMRFTASTPCFRAEAGAAGKDTRGMIRQHQFTKVELVSITTPEQSRDEHERMLSCAEEVLRRLDLHYRVVTLCAGDMGFASQKTYDIEVWLPGQNMFREISSCSVCGDFQARRMNARFRDKDRRNRYVHTLNGSGVAVGRALIAVMENYQQADGSVSVPEVLQPYMGNVKSIGGHRSNESETGPG